MVPSCSFWNFWRRMPAEDVSPLMLCLSLADAGASPFSTCAACARAEAFCLHCSRNSGHSDSVFVRVTARVLDDAWPQPLAPFCLLPAKAITKCLCRYAVLEPLLLVLRRYAVLWLLGLCRCARASSSISCRYRITPYQSHEQASRRQ